MRENFENVINRETIFVYNIGFRDIVVDKINNEASV